MPDTCSMTVVKTMTYKSQDEEWSNTYHFDTQPESYAEWVALAEAVTTAERAIYAPDVKVSRAYFYEAGNNSSVSQKVWGIGIGQGLAGTATSLVGGGAGTKLPGDCTIWLRAYIGKNGTGRNKYVRKYFHGAYSAVGNPDVPSNFQRLEIGAFGDKMIDGTLPKGAKWCGPQGQSANNIKVDTFIGYHQFRARGKRPPR